MYTAFFTLITYTGSFLDKKGEKNTNKKLYSNIFKCLV